METVVTRVNSSEEMAFDEWLERGRQWWKASAARIIECDYLLVIDAGNIVRAAGRIRGVERDIEGGTGRTGIMVIPEPANEWLGLQIMRPGSRNPVVYIKEITEA
ncbi:MULTISPECIES: hypothetical protein [unclassified Leucobacter]|uniref:hypothetical protein n=1 Tax=unclassified Leucobacter TaxID=2621730 RepID=UPI003018B986